MKPIYEQAKAADLKSGDVVERIVDDIWIEAATIRAVGQSDGEFIEIDFGKGPVRELDDAVFWRRIPDSEDPRVLMYALKSACKDIALMRVAKDSSAGEVIPQRYIEQARETLERESTS